MVRNVRWLHSKLGTTDFSNVGGGTVTGALSSLQTELSGKADSTHSHTTGDLPVTNSLSTNSASYIPSSSAVYSLQSIINDLNTEIQNMNDQLDPNKRYESKDLGAWSSASDVDTFLSKYNHDNLYKNGNTELSIGNYVTIYDGIYDTQWIIAGFDCEHNQTAADGTVYDNGYGICMIPKTRAGGNGAWASTSSLEGGYNASIAHSAANAIAERLKDYILYTHTVQRNVLLSNSVVHIDTTSRSNGYIWTTAYGALMSVGQFTGTFGVNNTMYDDGEANYKMPLFNHVQFYSYDGGGHRVWTRNIGDAYYGDRKAWAITSSNISYNGVAGVILGNVVYDNYSMCPMIYIR